MKKGICPKCFKVKYLTKHSTIGGHHPPFELICRECHDEEHGIKQSSFKSFLRKRGKYAFGTKRQHKKNG